MLKRLSKLLPKRFRNDVPTVPVVRLQGMIAAGGSTFNPTLSLASCAQNLERAFKMKEAPAVALAVNSPGGSPVQSRLIYKRIRDLAKEHDKEVLVFCEDVAASGGYMIACAGDEVFADPSSIVGSIGVISAGFGFVEAIDKIGVERRVYTAGKNKSTLDPFAPAKEEDIARIKELQLEIHDVFIDLVKESRGDKLADDDDLFTGRFWAGGKAQELGLIDEIGDIRGVIKDRFGEKAELRLMSQPRSLFGRRSGIGGVDVSAFDARHIGAGAAHGILTTLEERALWNRFGL
ncbi:MAG: S49 family peptidase [Pseudomonadota bacterium]